MKTKSTLISMYREKFFQLKIVLFLQTVQTLMGPELYIL